MQRLRSNGPNTPQCHPAPRSSTPCPPIQRHRPDQQPPPSPPPAVTTACLRVIHIMPAHTAPPTRPAAFAVATPSGHPCLTTGASARSDHPQLPIRIPARTYRLFAPEHPPSLLCPSPSALLFMPTCVAAPLQDTSHTAIYCPPATPAITTNALPPGGTAAPPCPAACTSPHAYLPGWTTTLADRLLGRGLHAVYTTVSKLCSHIGHADALRLQRASLRRGPSRSTYGTVTLGEATAFTNGRRKFSVRTTGWRRIHYGRHRLHHFTRCHLHYCRGRPSWRRSAG